MRTLSLVIALVLIVNTLSAQASKTLVNTFQLEGASTLELKLPQGAVVEVVYIDNRSTKLTVEMTVTPMVGQFGVPENVLTSLVKAGRYSQYNVEASPSTGELTLSYEESELLVIYKSSNVEDKYRFKVYVPQGTMIVNSQPYAERIQGK